MSTDYERLRQLVLDRDNALTARAVADEEAETASDEAETLVIERLGLRRPTHIEHIDMEGRKNSIAVKITFVLERSFFERADE